MLRIQRSENGEVVFTLSGQMDDDPIAELEKLIHSEADGRRIILDLKDVTRVDENAIAFLERCEAKRITLKNCAGYIREWITRQRREAKG
jgi:anti-anti-sigma regulatory factor